MRWTRASTALMIGLAAAAPALRAAEPRLPDADFLEFLGSIDGEGEGWADFLETSPGPAGKPTPPVKAAPPAATKPPAAPPAKPPADTTPPKGQ